MKKMWQTCNLRLCTFWPPGRGQNQPEYMNLPECQECCNAAPADGAATLSLYRGLAAGGAAAAGCPERSNDTSHPSASLMASLSFCPNGRKATRLDFHDMESSSMPRGQFAKGAMCACEWSQGPEQLITGPFACTAPLSLAHEASRCGLIAH